MLTEMTWQLMVSEFARKVQREVTGNMAFMLGQSSNIYRAVLPVVLRQISLQNAKLLFHR